MLVIRLLRTGKKNQPTFKMVVIDKRKASTHGRVVEEVGFYNPLNKEKVLKKERIKYWLSVGAKPSDTVYNFFVSEKIIEGKKIDVHKESKKKEEKEAPAEKAEEDKKEMPPKPSEEKPAEEKKPVAEEKPKEEPKEKPKGEKPKEDKPEKKKPEEKA